MVVSAEDDIRLRDRLGEVIANVGSHWARIPLLLPRTTVHKADQEIRLLTQDLRQVGPGGLYLVSKLEPAPEMGRKVVGEGRHGEPEDGDLLSPFLHHHIGLEVGLTRSGVHHVGSEDGEVRLPHKAVVDAVPGLDVVVADRHRIVAEVVVHLGHRMRG